MSYLTKDQVLKSFEIEEVKDPGLSNNVVAWELFFVEGGKKQRVAVYYDEDDYINYMDEDALMYWMQVLKRTWDDDELFEPEHEEKKQLLKFKVED